MSNVFAILKRELRAYFYSPIAYVVYGLFLVLTGFFFSLLLFSSRQATLQPLTYNIIITLLFFAPLLTMKLFAEERKMGTLEMLMTKPVRDVEVVLGKFFAALSFYLLMLVSTLVYVGVILQFGDPDIGPIITGYVGLFFVGASFIALGTFASTLTENQIISAVITFSLALLFWILNWLSGNFGLPSESIFSQLSLSFHFDDFVKGVVDWRSVVFYISFIFFWIFATVKSIEVRKWK
jgi:ABC-2 type transport system permease protein